MFMILDNGFSPACASSWKMPAPPELLAALRPVYAGYLTVQEALADDDQPAAQRAARALHEELRKIDHAIVPKEGHVVWMREAKRLRDASLGVAEGKPAQRASSADDLPRLKPSAGYRTCRQAA